MAYFSLEEGRAEYARLSQTLACPGWISEGYAQDRGPGAGGPCYQWTRKVKNKTVSVVLSKEQYVTNETPLTRLHHDLFDSPRQSVKGHVHPPQAGVILKGTTGLLRSSKNT